MATLTCPDCKTINPAESRFCTSCGQPLKTVVMKKKAAKKPGRKPTEVIPAEHKPAKPTVWLARIRARLLFENGGEIVLEGGPQFDIGRKDLANDWDPAIDLTPFGGEAGGVSRRHGFILFTEEGPQITDTGSLNKTLVNGIELVADQAHALENNDQLLFGAVPARFVVE